jgi:Zn-dependent protease with chaperone function
VPPAERVVPAFGAAQVSTPPEPSSSLREDGWAPAPGPVDRVTFFAEQRRHRRAFWWAATFSFVAIVIMGFAFSIVASPVVILLGALAARLAGLFVPVPAFVWDVFRALVDLFAGVKLALLDWRLSPDELAPSLRAVLLLLLPGALGVVLLWLATWRLLFRAGVGGILLGLGARAPRPGDREERQLVNVVEEIAIAAGVPPPRVMLLDVDVANAAAVGSSFDDATLLVTRRLLDELDRDETQGILAHLVASTANGDLRILLTFLSVFQTFGLIMTLLDAPLSGRAFGQLWRLLGVALSGAARGRGRDAEAEMVAAMLVGSLDLGAIEDAGNPIDAMDRRGINPLHRVLLYVRFFLVLPLMLVSMEAKLLLFLFTLLFLGPVLWWMLRARRHLADATAVQLTRNPDGLAQALLILSVSPGEPPGGEWGEPLFVAGSELSRATGARSFTSHRVRSQDPAAASDSAGGPASAAKGVPRRKRRGAVAAATQGLGGSLLFMGAHPPLSSRLKRLRALGAAIQPVDDKPRKPSPASTAPPESTATLTAAEKNSNPILTAFAWVVVALVLVGLGYILLHGAAFVLYLFAVGLFGAAFVLAGLFIVVMEIVARLIPF